MRGHLAVMLLVVVGLAGCRDEYQWRQKLTVTVDTPAGARSGSAVSSVTALYGTVWLAGTEVEYEQGGEAVVVPLPDGRVLAALIEESQQEIAARTFRDALPRDRKDWLPLIARLKDSRSVPSEALPRFALFSDPLALETAQIVSAAELVGYGLKSVTLEITQEPETAGMVERTFPWVTRSFDQAAWERLGRRRWDVVWGLRRGRK